MSERKSVGRPVRDPIPVAELKWVTPRLDTLLEAKEVTIWGAVAVVMSRLGIERETIVEYLAAINEAEMALIEDEEFFYAFDIGAHSSERESKVLTKDDLYSLYDDELWYLDFFGDRDEVWLRRGDAIHAVEALEFERLQAVLPFQLASMVYHALKSDIESARSSFKYGTVLKLPYDTEKVTVLIKQTQLGKESRFFESHVGKVLQMAINNPVEVKVHDWSPEYQLIGVLSSLLTSMFPTQFRIKRRANVEKLATFVEQNISKVEQQDFRQKRTIKAQIERGLRASEDLRSVRNPVLFGEQQLKSGGIDLAEHLSDVDRTLSKLVPPKSENEN